MTHRYHSFVLMIVALCAFSVAHSQALSTRLCARQWRSTLSQSSYRFYTRSMLEKLDRSDLAVKCQLNRANGVIELLVQAPNRRGKEYDPTFDVLRFQYFRVQGNTLSLYFDQLGWQSWDLTSNDAEDVKNYGKATLTFKGSSPIFPKVIFAPDR